MPLSSLKQLGSLAVLVIQYYKQLIVSTEAETLDGKNKSILTLL